MLRKRILTSCSAIMHCNVTLSFILLHFTTNMLSFHWANFAIVSFGHTDITADMLLLLL